MIAFLKRADHVIFKIQEYICIITSVLITSLIVIAAIMRYILGINFGGSEELVLFAAFWFYFTGSSLAYRDDAHINADMTSLLFKSEKAKKRMAVVKYAVSMVIAIVATAWAFQFVSWSFELWPTTPIYKLPLALSRLSIIISFILMSIYVLIHLIRSVAFEFYHNAVVPDVYPVHKHFHGCAINRGERITLHRLLYECIEPQPDLSIFGCRSLQLVALCLQFLHPLTVLFDP